MDYHDIATRIAAMTAEEAAAAYPAMRAEQEEAYQRVSPRTLRNLMRNIQRVRDNATRHRPWYRSGENCAAAEQMEHSMAEEISDYDALVFRKFLLAVRRGSYDHGLYSPSAGYGSSIAGQVEAATIVADARRRDPGVVIPPRPEPYVAPTWRLINTRNGGEWVAGGTSREEVEAKRPPLVAVVLQERTGNDWRTVERFEACEG